MHRALSARWITKAMRLGDLAPSTIVPVFLCPSVHSAVHRHHHSCSNPHRTTPSACRAQHQREFHAVAEVHDDIPSDLKKIQTAAKKLPLNCSGCGAFSQTNDPTQFGFYNLNSRRIKSWLQPKERDASSAKRDKDKDVEEVLAGLSEEWLRELGLEEPSWVSGTEEVDANQAHPTPEVTEKSPHCDRCHNLIHNRGSLEASQVTMYHPTAETLRETIEESPYKYNHIYHVIDAADFPMSLVPKLNVLLGDIPLRSQNRRSRSAKFYKDRKMELSFIITRGDLLGPTKEIVDNMMPYLREVLRDALGRIGGRVRLGNVRCVSAQRGWWTKTLKEDIWKRGGAGWMVGKVNVGKSQLFEAIYPKGRMIDAPAPSSAVVSMYPRDVADPQPTSDEAAEDDDLKDLNVGDLLPPAQPARNYPEMPIVSSLPGTTASPIRVPFGNGKGELIDLPGLSRGDLELYVKPEHRESLIMKSRVVPNQVSITSKSSLLLGGGLIRITPRTPNVVFLMYNFTPLKEHMTNAEKAEQFQNQTAVSDSVENITLPDRGDVMKHAGTFKLCHDVTKKRAGPLTRKNDVGLQVEKLPFRVFSVDILIEGVGYVEVVAQVRARDMKPRSFERKRIDHPTVSAVELAAVVSDDPFSAMTNQRRDTTRIASPEADPNGLEDMIEPRWPAVDVYTPEGQFVGSRKPIQGWLANKPLLRQEHKKSRPRKSMRGMKKKEKMARRAGV